MFPGCYISISDLTYISEQNTKHGTPNKIYPPGLPQISINEITNVIPVFDDKKIHTFLTQYAPNLLEYTASVGMRRVISNVHMTYCYTLCGGLWKIVELLDKNKSTVNTTTFKNLSEVYNYVADKHFNHVLKLIDKPISPEDQNLSYFINNNGITNMINPIYNMIKLGKTEYLSNVIRSAYSYEASQIIRSYLKKSNYDDRRQASMNTLISLLGIDYTKFGLKPQAPFVQENPDIKFHDGYILNEKLYEQLIGNQNKLNYVVLLPDLFSTLLKNNDENVAIELIKELPEIDDTYFAKVLGINYDVNYFKLATLVQSLLFFNKKDRVDAENFKMKVTDLGTLKNAKQVITNFITCQYKQYYYNQIVTKKIEEKKLMILKLVKNMTSCETINEYIKLFHEGLEYDGTIFKIINSCSLGFVELQKELFESNYVPKRDSKLEILFLGKYKEETIWNNGNALRVVLSKYKDSFEKLELMQVYKFIENKMKDSIKHIYREHKRNRQGHGNDFPSYFAYGYLSIEAMKDNVTEEFWKDYNIKHHSCCGN